MDNPVHAAATSRGKGSTIEVLVIEVNYFGKSSNKLSGNFKSVEGFARTILPLLYALSIE